MKKRLLVLSIMVGLMLVVSSSVFGASDTVSYNISAGIGGYADIQGNYTARIVNVVIRVTNNSDKWAVSSQNYFTLNTTLGRLGTNAYINGLSVDNFNNCSATPRMNSYLSENPVIDVQFENGFILAPYEVRDLNFDIKYQVIGSFTVGFSATVSNQPTVTYKTIEDLTEYPRSELSLLDRIRLILESDPDVGSDLNNSSQAIDNQESVIHQQEMQWYQANEQAINQVGLDNFNFGSGTISGFQIMQQQFSDIWSALGDLNLVYSFTLLISLATFIIRHHPNTKRPDPNEDEIRQHNLEVFYRNGRGNL